MASFSCRISPRTSTVIFFDRSPLATAIVTSAMLRTCAVRLLAIELTLSVRSFHTPVTSRTCAWPPSLPSVPTSRATRVTSEVNTPSCLIMVLTMVADCRNSPFSGRPSTSRRTVCSRSPWATAATARVTSVVGQSRSSISVLTEVFHLAPGAAGNAELHALAGLALAADDLPDTLELLRHALVGGGDLVEGVGDLFTIAGLLTGHADRKIARAHRLQGGQELVFKRCRTIARRYRVFRQRNRCGRRAVRPLLADQIAACHGALPRFPCSTPSACRLIRNMPSGDIRSELSWLLLAPTPPHPEKTNVFSGFGRHLLPSRPGPTGSNARAGV